MKALFLFSMISLITACSQPIIDSQEVIAPPVEDLNSINAKALDVSVTRIEYP